MKVVQTHVGEARLHTDRAPKAMQRASAARFEGKHRLVRFAPPDAVEDRFRRIPSQTVRPPVLLSASSRRLPLAAEAGVSFATPFNQFGSKAAIMQALSARRIATMAARFAAAARTADAVERVLLAVRIGVEVLLEEPDVNRAVMGWLGTSDPAPSTVLAQSSDLWRAALGEGEGLLASNREAAVRDLPKILAFLFRGVLSFRTAGEIADADLSPAAHDAALALLGGYPGPAKASIR